MNSKWKHIAGSAAIALAAVLLVVSATFYLLFGSVGNGWKMARAMYILRTQYVHQLQSDQLMQGLLTGLVKSTEDAHSEYLSSQAYQRLQEAIGGTHVGVGLLLSQQDGEVYVQEVIPGGNAAQSGKIVPGDRIDKVDSEAVSDIPLADVVARISGTKGTQVVLEIRHVNGDVESLTLTRDEFVVPTVVSRFLTADIACIRIRSFTEETPTDFRKEYERLRFNGMRKLVIDLRDNPGGSLHAVTEIAKQVLPQGTLVKIISRSGGADTIELPGAADAVPLVVLINRRSASASEILASAVQDLQAGVIVGETSYGKGTVQGVFPLSGEDGMRLTVAEYFSSKGHSINGKGVTPDVQVHPEVMMESEWMAAAVNAF